MTSDKCHLVSCHDPCLASLTHQIVAEVRRQVRGYGESLSGVRVFAPGVRGVPEVHHALPVATLSSQSRHQGSGAQVQHALLSLAAGKSSALVKTMSKMFQII